MQMIVCKVKQCGYCGANGFCLNRLTSINQQGVCGYLTKPGWNNPVEDRFKNNFVEKEQQETREPVERIVETKSEEKQGSCEG